MIFVTGYLGGTHGTAKSARDFLRSLLASGSHVKVISPVREEFPLKLCDTTLSNPEWLTLPTKIKLPRKPWKLRPALVKSWIKNKKQNIDFILKTRRDLVFVNGWASYSLWQSIESYFKGPKVLIVRESPRHFSGPDRDQVLQEMVDTFSKFDHLIFVSDNVRKEWLHNNKLSKIGFSVLPNCCEEEDATACLALERSALREEYGFATDDFIVLCPGSIEHRKGQDLLLKVIPQMMKAIPKLRVIIVGDSATEWGQDLLQSIHNDDKENTISHLYARPDLFDLLRISDILAFPSRAEAMPRTILESMVMKTAVVASAVDGIPELIENGLTGILFKCDDSEGLLQGILSLYSDSILRVNLADSGSERYWSHFSRAHQFKRMKVILKKFKFN